jgi:hypothetical protein
MSYESGWNAINLIFSSKVPRVEYSAYSHWKLVQAVTGIDASIESNRAEARKLFIKKWDYAFIWNIQIGRNYLSEKGGRTTNLGHAIYLPDGSDFRDSRSNGFESPEDAIMLDPCKEYGEWTQEELIKRFEEYYAMSEKEFPGPVNMSGVYVSMVSGMIEIFGFDTLLLTLGMYPKEFNKVLDGYFQWVKQFFDAYAKTNIPVMMVHDDLCWTEGPFMPPSWYREQIFPRLKKLIEPVKAAGKKIIFTSDGTIDVFFDDIINLEVDSVVMEPTSNIELFLSKHGKRCGAVGGIDCRTLTYGSHEVIEDEVKRVMNFGKKYPGFIFACGNHLPSDVPVEKALFYNEMYEKYATR